MLNKIAGYVEAGCRLVLIMRHNNALLDFLDRVARLEQVGAHHNDPLAGRKT